MQRILFLLLLLGLAGAYQWWHKHPEDPQSNAIAGESLGNIDADGSGSRGGFIPVEMPSEASRNSVLILAPENCPSEQAQRAESLAANLAQRGIPVTRGASLSFDLENPTAEQKAGVERAVSVFNQGAPAVFINGMAMSNPSAAQSAAEYQRTKL